MKRCANTPPRRRGTAPTALALGLAVGAAVCARAGDAGAAAYVELQTEAARVEVGRPFRVRYSVHIRNESSPQVSPLNFGALQVMSDPNPPGIPTFFGGGSPGFSLSLDTSTDYVVRAMSPGRFVISGARVVDQRTGRALGVARDMIVEAVPAGGSLQGPDPNADPNASAAPDPSAPPAPPPDPDAPPSGDLTGAIFHSTAFLRAAVDRPRPWLGQQVVFRAWLYTSSTESNCEVTDEPAFQGFWNESLLPLSRECAVRWFSTTVGNSVMAAGLVRRVALFPTQTGTLTVTRLAATADVLSGGLFRSLQRVETRTPELRIEVREPPLAGRPADYIPGTVGPLEVTANLDRAQVPTGETAVLTVTVRSPNSLASLRVRPPANVDGLRVRDGDVRVEHERSETGIVSTLRADFLLVPERPGLFVLGSTRIPYWNAETERYVDAQFTLPTLSATGAALARDGASAGADPLGELRGFSTRPALDPPARWVPGPRGSLALVLAPPVLGAALWGVARGLSRLRARRNETRAALADDPRDLFARARRALESAPKDALSLASRALDRAARAARDERDDRGEIPAVRDARGALEAARFTGDGSPEGARDALAAVGRALDALEEQS